ncbi:MAG: SCO family protein [Acidimicrobiia bacterium]
MKGRRLWTGIAVGLLGVLVAWFVILPHFVNRVRPHIFGGTVVQSNQKVPNTELMSANGPVRLSDFAGKLLVVYFGYTYCPDVCPATLSKLADSMEIVGDKADDVQVIMVSIDPARDTPDVIQDYVTHFDPDFLGLTGDEASVNLVATLFGVTYQRVDNAEATSYTMDHTSTVILVDREGYLKLVLPFEGSAEQIASDIDFFLSK